jgi:hypothetical protein
MSQQWRRRTAHLQQRCNVKEHCESRVAQGPLQKQHSMVMATCKLSPLIAETNSKSAEEHLLLSFQRITVPAWPTSARMPEATCFTRANSPSAAPCTCCCDCCGPLPELAMG